MSPQSGLQTIAIHILLNISQSKGNQRMKFGQLIEYCKTNIFLQKLCRKSGKQTSSKRFFLFSFLKKAQYEVKASGLQLSLQLAMQYKCTA